MKILHISRTMGQGGAEKIVYQLCRDVCENKCIVASTGGTYVKQLEELGIKHFVIPDINNKKLHVMFQTYNILNKIIKSENVDVVHTHHRMAAFYSELIYKSNRNIKLIYTAHNVFYNKKSLLRFALKDSTIIAVGNGVKENLTTFYKIDSAKIRVINNSVIINSENILDNELTVKIKKMKERNKCLIGCIGRLSKQKGIDLFIKAMKCVTDSHKDAIGLIIGDGEEKSLLKQLVNELNLNKNIIFLGYQNNVTALIKMMDFIVLPSRWEGLPLTPIETFSQEKTIVVSDVSGNNEVVTDYYNGLYFEKENYLDLANKIDEMIVDRKQRRLLEENAYETYIEKYEYSVFVKKYKEVYDQCHLDNHFN